MFFFLFLSFALFITENERIKDSTGRVITCREDVIQGLCGSRESSKENLIAETVGELVMSEEYQMHEKMVYCRLRASRELLGL